VTRAADEPFSNEGAQGVARKIDHLGRVVIPAEFRKVFGIREGDLLDMTIEGDGMLLRKLERGCVFCESTADLGMFRSKLICKDCHAALATGT
jgi:AbrB family transcriptional regulator, transcriptional pleiotropic regulator of transition state genes